MKRKDLLSDKLRFALFDGLFHVEMVIWGDNARSSLELLVHELSVAFSIPVHVDCATCLAVAKMSLDELVSELQFVK